MTLAAIDLWHEYFGTHDYDRLSAMLHPDVVFESPVVHTPQRGRDITLKYLIAADQILFNDSFKYVGEWRSADGAVLEFVTEVDGMIVNGIDMITTTPDWALITGFKVMLRPLKAINAVHQKMGEQLARSAG